MLAADPNWCTNANSTATGGLHSSHISCRDRLEPTPLFAACRVTRPAATPARARLGKGIATPRTASELHDLWDVLDSKFTEQTIAWLAKASKQVTSVRPFGTQYCCSTLTTSPGRAGEAEFKAAAAKHPAAQNTKVLNMGRQRLATPAARMPDRKALLRIGPTRWACGRESNRRRNTFRKSRPPSRAEDASRLPSAVYERPPSAMRRNLNDERLQPDQHGWLSWSGGSHGRGPTHSGSNNDARLLC